MATGQRQHKAVGTDVARIEVALTTIVRQTNLPEARARMTAATGIDLDRGAYVVLTRVDAWQPLRLSDLAWRLGVEVPTASRHVKRLESAGYLTRAQDPDDGRACLLTLTAAGGHAVQQMRHYRQQSIAELLSGWDRGDRRQLAELLDRLVLEVQPRRTVDEQ